MESMKKIYDSLWEESTKRFKDNKFELDYHLNNKEDDKRRGITIIARLESKVIVNILDFLNKCKLIEPSQHYYDSSDMHITILSIITCFNGFTIDSINKEAYVDIIRKSIKKEGAMKIAFKGITASSSCVMVQGFPLDNRLNLLRQQLRNNFRNSTLEHSMDKRYTLGTAHSTIIRFKNPIINNNLFIECLKKYRDYDFGVSEINNIEFVYNDWYMDNSIVSKIKTISL